MFYITMIMVKIEAKSQSYLENSDLR